MNKEEKLEKFARKLIGHIRWFRARKVKNNELGGDLPQILPNKWAEEQANSYEAMLERILNGEA